MSIQVNSVIPTEYWHTLEDGRVQCDVCPRACKLHEDQRGLCYVRGRRSTGVEMFSYGRSSGFCIDPVEKKPLNHFLPGSPVLSFGTAGCNLACKFCQNWDMSKSREMDTLASYASAEQLATAALENGCRSIAFTYNDPVIFMEYAIDTAIACRARGIKSIAVTAGYICAKPREAFFDNMDASNIDLKSFNEGFYYKTCGAHLAEVLETILYVHNETKVWLELTTLLIPKKNDSDKELHALTEWIADNLGSEVPLHFTAFHPDFKMLDSPATPAQTLMRARNIALSKGLNYVYTGNVRTPDGGSNTGCPGCGKRLIERDSYRLGDWNLTEEGCCNACGKRIAGVFEAQPGHWGAKRQPIKIVSG